VAQLTGTGPIFDGSDAFVARKLQGSDDRKWSLSNPEEPPKNLKKARLPWLVCCVTPVSMFQLPTDIWIAMLGLLLGWRRYILFDPSSDCPYKAIAADNNAEPKVLCSSRRIYNEACLVLNDINKFMVHHTVHAALLADTSARC
jgi:hypothetical protein